MWACRDAAMLVCCPQCMQVAQCHSKAVQDPRFLLSSVWAFSAIGSCLALTCCAVQLTGSALCLARPHAVQVITRQVMLLTQAYLADAVLVAGR